MKVLKLKPHYTTAEFSDKLMSCANNHHRVYWQILLSVSFNPNKKAEEYASFIGVSKSKVYRVVEQFNKKGKSFLDSREWGGRRDKTAYLTLEEESKLMDDIRSKAVKGMILTANDVIMEIEEKLKIKVSDDYVWDLFKRHNWKKKSPRPQHPKHDQNAQDEFKKNSQKYWTPGE